MEALRIIALKWYTSSRERRFKCALHSPSHKHFSGGKPQHHTRNPFLSRRSFLLFRLLLSIEKFLKSRKLRVPKCAGLFLRLLRPDNFADTAAPNFFAPPKTAAEKTTINTPKHGF